MQNRRWPHVVGWIVVLVAVASVGTVQALPGTNTVDSGDIANGEVRRPDIEVSAVNSAKIGDGTIQGIDVADNGLTGSDIDESTLQLGCRNGLLHRSILVRGSPAVPNTFTNEPLYVDYILICSGDNIFVRRVGVGVYRVQFQNDPAEYAQVSLDSSDGDTDNVISVSKVTATDFEVVIRDISAGSLDDGWFIITTF